MLLAAEKLDLSIWLMDCLLAAALVELVEKLDLSTWLMDCLWLLPLSFVRKPT
jgi:hypothetical protein